MTAMSSEPGFAGVAEGRPFTVDDLEASPMTAIRSCQAA
jgi:hypothetical protein